MAENGSHGLSSPTAVVSRNPRTAARTVNGKALVVVIDKNELHTLNESGSFLWEQCDGKTLPQLVELLARRYRLDEEVAVRDVHLFVEALLRTQAITLEEP